MRDCLSRTKLKKLILIFKFQNECSMIQVFKRFQEKMMMNYWSNFLKSLHRRLFFQDLISLYRNELKMTRLIILLIKSLSKQRLPFERFQIAISKSRRKNLCLNSQFEYQILVLMQLWTLNLNPHRDKKMTRLFQYQDQKKS